MAVDDDYNPICDYEGISQEECHEHIFMPIDGTGEFLACRNCGFVVNRKNLKDINFFRNRNSDI